MRDTPGPKKSLETQKREPRMQDPGPKEADNRDSPQGPERRRESRRSYRGRGAEFEGNMHRAQRAG